MAGLRTSDVALGGGKSGHIRGLHALIEFARQHIVIFRFFERLGMIVAS